MQNALLHTRSIAEDHRQRCSTLHGARRLCWCGSPHGPRPHASAGRRLRRRLRAQDGDFRAHCKWIGRITSLHKHGTQHSLIQLNGSTHIPGCGALWASAQHVEDIPQLAWLPQSPGLGQRRVGPDAKEPWGRLPLLAAAGQAALLVTSAALATPA